MTGIEYKKNITDIFYICSCAVNNTQLEQNDIKTIDLDHLYEAAKKHMLASMVGQILQKARISSQPFKNAVSIAQRKAVIFNNDLSNIISELEASGIWYMPLKGSVLQAFYPSFAMREMCDIDVLFDASRGEDVKTIMKRLGFQVMSFGSNNDDDYLKPPVSNCEMHRSLFGNKHDKKLYKYYKDVKKRLIKDEDNNYGYHFSPEDFYIFMIAHEYKHYNNGGTGLRSLLDTYIYLKNHELDTAYVTVELKKLGILEYEQKNRSLATKLFSGETLTEEEQLMLDYIIFSGTFGTLEHQIDNTGGKIKYFFRRVYGPIGKDDPWREDFMKRYETFFKYPILLPFLPFYRLFRAIRINPKRLKAEAIALIKAGTKMR